MPDDVKPPAEPIPPKPQAKIVAGFHVVELENGQMDVGFLPGMSAKTLLALLGVATIKVHDQVRAFEQEQIDQIAKEQSFLSRFNLKRAAEKRKRRAERNKNVALVPPPAAEPPPTQENAS